MALLAKQTFARRRIHVPDDWNKIFPHTPLAFQQLIAAIPPAERDVPDPPLGPDLLFERHLPLQLFAKQQKELCQTFGDYIDRICSAICAAWDAWISSAKVVTTSYAAGLANGGQVVAPPWAPTIIAQGPNVPWTPAIASAISTCWLQFEASLRFLGAPLFMGNLMIPVPPGGDSMPGIPPPTGPLPLRVACPAQAPILKEQLIALMQAVPPPPPPAPDKPTPSYGPHSDALYEAIADAFAQCFLTWTAATLVDSTQFLLVAVNPSPVPIPRAVGLVPTTTGPFLITPPAPPQVWVPMPHQLPRPSVA